MENFLGLSGFIWWIGVVESRNDPLNLGRCQVRIFGWHTDDKNLIPTEDLAWAQLVSFQQTPPIEGSFVMGFFMDGENAQVPMMMGIIPGIPEELLPTQKGFSDQRTDEELQNSPRPPENVEYKSDGTGVVVQEASSAKRYPVRLGEPTISRIARGNLSGTVLERIKDNVIQDSEIPTAYAVVYPFDQVVESHSGHITEIDDTPGAERLMRAHRTGTFEEMHPDGSRVLKVVKDNYTITMGDDSVLIQGKCTVVINGDASITVKGDTDLEYEGNLKTTVKGDMTTTVEGNITQTASGTVTIDGSEIFIG